MWRWATLGMVAVLLPLTWAGCAGTDGAGAQDLAATPDADRIDAQTASAVIEIAGQRERTAGATTVYATGRNAFSFPLANLADEGRTRFVIGNSFFRRNWVEAPSSTRARDGLGPHFIARSCGGCHVQDGRGAPPDFKRGLAPEDQEEAVALLLRLSRPGRGAHGNVVPDPVYGDQLNNAAVQGVRPEGQLRIAREPWTVTLADGTVVTLQRPVYTVTDLGYGPLPDDILMSARIAPQLPGVGLLEAIPDDELLRNVAAQAARGDAITGRVNRVWDAHSNAMRIGRFGWKANVATIADQTANAFAGDIGITSRLHPLEACTATQEDCRHAPRGAQGRAPEIDDKTLDNVIFYQATLGPAARRAVNDPQVKVGARLFAEAQCAVCHRPSYRTEGPPFPALSAPEVVGQQIWPYTDLLLHDMGEALADGRPDFDAGGREWKTPPLWGIGLIHDVNGHQRLLHDGRADGVLEAILWHGGEAAASRDAVVQLSADERAALVKFVESL